MLCAYGLRGRTLRRADAAQPGRAARVSRIAAAMFSDVQRLYGRSLAWTLRHSWLALLVLGGVIALNVYLYMALPKTLLPRQDTGIVHAFVRGDDGFSFQVMQPKIEAYRRLLVRDPAVAHVAGTSGGAGGISNSSLMVSLKPLAERGEPTQAVINRLRTLAPAVPGAILSPMIEQDLSLIHI